MSRRPSGALFGRRPEIPILVTQVWLQERKNHDHTTFSAPWLHGANRLVPEGPGWFSDVNCIPQDLFVAQVRLAVLLISDGAQVEGSIIAQDVTVCGRVKGTIRAVRVKLQNGGAVEGDIFHRSLSIDENSQFEGSSRRVENPTEIPSSIDAKIPQTTDTQSPTPMSNVDADLQRVESAPTDWSESTVEPKH